MAPWRAMLAWTVIACALLAVAFAAGCGARTVFVTESAPARIGPNARARVWTYDGQQWVLSHAEVVIPEGYYIVSPGWVDGGSADVGP